MSSIVNKVKNAVSGNSTSTGVSEGTHGPHTSRTANAADPRIDSDLDHRAVPGSTVGDANTTYTTGDNYTTGTTGAGYGTSTTGAGYGTSGVTGTTGRHHQHVPEGTAGPHSSRIANAADPRVDSDLDSTRHTGTTGMTGRTTGAGVATTGTTRSGATEGSHGPHNSRIANALDPRVDSDRDGSRTVGGTTGTTGTTGTHHTSGLTGTTGTTGAHHTSGLTGTTGTTGAHHTSGLTGTTGTTGTHHHNAGTTGAAYGTSGVPEGTAGPHSSRVANAVDPRVDSDLDGSRRTAGTGMTGTTGTHHTVGTTGTTGNHHHTAGTTGTTGLTGTHHTAGTTGVTGTHHTAGTAGVTGTHQHTAGTTGAGIAPGPAPNTAGPHKSDMMNKIDPRVDSDLDGSRTVGGNKTYSADPTDAAQVPPSIMRKHIGEPEIAHSGHSGDHSRRHSLATAQEQHSGL